MPNLWIKIRERSDRPGKWIVDVRRDAQRHPRTFDSQEEAEAFAREVKRAERAGELAVAKDRPQTLGLLTEAFLVAKAGEGLAAATLKTYRGLLTQTVVPRLGGATRARDLTEESVVRYRDARIADKVSPTTIYRELDRLRALLGYAKQLGLVARNVVDGVKFPRLKDEPKDWLRSNEVGPFLDACLGDFLPIGKFTIFTGLRRREVVFLQRGDVDLVNNVIQIRSKPHLDFRPKSGRERSVPIDPTLRPLLERHLREHAGPGLDAWVFPKRDGSRRSGSTRWFAVSTQQTAKRAGIDRPLTFHDLRRTYGAMLIESGVGIYEVSRLLGHSDVRITQRVYAPICGKFLAQEASKLGRYLGPLLRREVPKVTPLKFLGAKQGS